MKGARGLLINITGGSDITLFEMDEAANRIREEVDEEANIMVGMALDESLAGRIRISVVATGIDSAVPSASQLPKFQVVGGGAVDAVAFPQHAQKAPEPQAAGAVSGQGGYIPQPPAKPLLSAAYAGANADTAELELAEPAVRAAPPAPRPVASPPRPVTPEPKRGTLFSRVFGGGSAPAAAAPNPRAAHHQEPVMSPLAYRQEPVTDLHAAQEPARAAVRQAQVEDIGLDIPAFLRRSS
jgi:cell division protein FtsZ